MRIPDGSLSVVSVLAVGGAMGGGGCGSSLGGFFPGSGAGFFLSSAGPGGLLGIIGA